MPPGCSTGESDLQTDPEEWTTTARPVSQTAVVSVIARDLSDRILVVRQRGRVSDGVVPSGLGGRVERGETFGSAFARECREELGVGIVRELESPDYSVELRRSDGVTRTAVFDRVCPELAHFREFTPQPGDRVESAARFSVNDALPVFLESPARHIAEPLVAHLAGQVHAARWRYDTDSARIPMTHFVEDRPSACVSGHFEVRGCHTELLGVPALYLLTPSELTATASALAKLIKPYHPDSLITPAVGGIALAAAVAIELGLPLAIAERTPDGRYARARGAGVTRRTALLDSTYHSGTTVTDMLRFVRSAGGELITSAVAVKSVVIDGQICRVSSIPVHAVETVVVHSWPSAVCPLCRSGVPLDRHPSRYGGNTDGES